MYKPDLEADLGANVERGSTRSDTSSCGQERPRPRQTGVPTRRDRFLLAARQSLRDDPTAPAAAPLFAPGRIGDLVLRNRIVMAPMTRKFSPNGMPGADVAAYYRRRAEHDVGLIITEGTVVDHPAAAADHGVPRFHGDDAMAAWRRVAEAVHDAGGRIMPQLWHVGAMRSAARSPCPEAPSLGPSTAIGPRPSAARPMTLSEIEAVIEAFANGAAGAEELGFDGVELHGAHGYLIDQFLWSRTNARTDRYGGDVASRTAFAVDIVTACRRRVSPDFPILFRLSQWKLQDYTARLAESPLELHELLKPLVDAGVDAFDCSTRYFWRPEFGGSDLNLAGWTKKLTGRPVIMVGSVWQPGDFLTRRAVDDMRAEDTLRAAERAVASGTVDFVAVGRALLADPEWSSKIRHGDLTAIRAFSPAALATLY